MLIFNWTKMSDSIGPRGICIPRGGIPWYCFSRSLLNLLSSLFFVPNILNQFQNRNTQRKFLTPNKRKGTKVRGKLENIQHLGQISNLFERYLLIYLLRWFHVLLVWESFWTSHSTPLKDKERGIRVLGLLIFNDLWLHFLH